jgi:hypothetical protein
MAVKESDGNPNCRTKLDQLAGKRISKQGTPSRQGLSKTPEDSVSKAHKHAVNPKSWTLTPQPYTLDHELWTLNLKP